MPFITEITNRLKKQYQRERKLPCSSILQDRNEVRTTDSTGTPQKHWVLIGKPHDSSLLNDSGKSCRPVCYHILY